MHSLISQCLGRDRFSSIPPLQAILNQSHHNMYAHGPGAACYIQQSAGELIFVPRHWSHQVVNLQVFK